MNTLKAYPCFTMSEKRKKIVGWITVSVVIVALFTFLFGSSGKGEQSRAMTISRGPESESGETEPETEEGFLYLTGAVRNEGVYPFSKGSRLFELIEKAGGFLPEADTSFVNLAETVRDGQHVRIPFQGESQAAPGEIGTVYVDLNAAGKQELMTLPGIGESKAEAILAYRKKNGPFRAVEDLLNVPGIGESILERLRELIKV